MLNKRADGGVAAVIIILLLIIFFGWMFSQSWKECRTHKDCRSDQVCNYRNECEDLPQPASTGNTNTLAALILGGALVIVAIIMKWDSLFRGNVGKKAELTNRYHAEDKCLYDDVCDEAED